MLPKYTLYNFFKRNFAFQIQKNVLVTVTDSTFAAVHIFGCSTMGHAFAVRKNQWQLTFLTRPVVCATETACRAIWQKDEYCKKSIRTHEDRSIDLSQFQGKMIKATRDRYTNVFRLFVSCFLLMNSFRLEASVCTRYIYKTVNQLDVESFFLILFEHFSTSNWFSRIHSSFTYSVMRFRPDHIS